MKKKLITLSLFTCFALLLVAQEGSFKEILEKCRRETQPAGADIIIPNTKVFDCLIGVTAPNFQGKTTTGEPVELAKLKGQVVVLYFFFHSCGEPCDAQIPALNEVVKKYRFDDVKFLALADDSEPELVDAYLREHFFEIKVIPQAHDIIWETFAHSIGFPALYVIDREGKVQYLTSGGSTEKEYIQPQMEALKMAIDKCLH